MSTVTKKILVVYSNSQIVHSSYSSIKHFIRFKIIIFYVRLDNKKKSLQFPLLYLLHIIQNLLSSLFLLPFFSPYSPFHNLISFIYLTHFYPFFNLYFYSHIIMLLYYPFQLSVGAFSRLFFLLCVFFKKP